MNITKIRLILLFTLMLPFISLGMIKQKAFTKEDQKKLCEMFEEKFGSNCPPPDTCIKTVIAQTPSNKLGILKQFTKEETEKILKIIMLEIGPDLVSLDPKNIDKKKQEIIENREKINELSGKIHVVLSAQTKKKIAKQLKKKQNKLKKAKSNKLLRFLLCCWPH